MTEVPRTAVVGVTAVLVVASATLVGGAAATGDQFVTMSASTSPAQPTTEGEFTFTTTFRSAAESDGPVSVDRIEVRDGPDSDAEVLASEAYVEDRPTLRPDGRVDESFSLSFDEAGTRTLYVAVTFVDGSTRYTSTYRTNVTVFRPGPGLEASAAPTTAGERTTVTVDVANGLDGAIRDVQLSLSADDVAFDDDTRVASSVAGGGTTSFAFAGTPETLGAHTVEATLTYTDDEGTRRRVTRELRVRFEEPSFATDLGLAVDVARAVPGADTALNLTLTNGLDANIRQLEVRLRADGATIAQSRRVGTALESGAQRTFRFTASRPTAGTQPVEVTVAFTTADGVEGEFTETLTARFQPPANPGEIRLTGTSAVQRGGELEISATASNVGSTGVGSVVVSIGDVEGVAPTDYFVGNVEAGDFSSFTLSPSVEGNVSSVPLTVTYVVDGVERSRTVEVPVERRLVREPSGGGGGVPGLAVGAVLLVVGAGAVVVYRRRG